MDSIAARGAFELLKRYLTCWSRAVDEVNPASGLRLLSLPADTAFPCNGRATRTHETRLREESRYFATPINPRRFWKVRKLGKRVAALLPSLPSWLLSFSPDRRPLLTFARIRPCLSSLSMSGHVCMPRVFLSGQLSREKHSRAPTILSDPDHLLDVSNARDTNVSCGIRGRRKADGPEKRSALLLPDATRSTRIESTLLLLCFFKQPLPVERLSFKEFFQIRPTLPLFGHSRLQKPLLRNVCAPLNPHDQIQISK